MNLEIKNGFVVSDTTNESISIDKLNKGLTDFYGQSVSIDNSNLNYFEGDILALCFGFTS